MSFSLTIVAALVAGQADFAKRARDPLTRDAAICAAYRAAPCVVRSECEHRNKERCAVRNVVETRDASGKRAFFVAFFHASFDAPAVGPTVGHFEVFNEFGVHLALFDNANVLEKSDALLLTSSSVGYFVQSIPWGDEHIRHITVVPAATPSQPVLNLCQLELVSDGGVLATWEWDPSGSAASGPSGVQDGPFFRLPNTDP